MRICYVATTTHLSGERNEGTGSSVHTLSLAQELKKLGNMVCIVSEGFSGEKENETIGGMKVYRLKRALVADSRQAKRACGGLLKYLKPLSSLVLGFKVAEIARRENCDIILERAQSLGAGAVASCITGKPLAVEVIDNLFSRRSIMRAKKVFAYTDVFFGEKTKSKLRIVGSGFDEALFKPAGLRKKFDICYCGSFKEWDGLEDLVEAVAILGRSGKVRNCRVVLVGNGTRFEPIKQMVDEKALGGNFTFAGRVPLREVPRFINSSAICVAPFNTARCKKGGFGRYGYYFAPLKMVEYMACGKPVVAADYPTIAGVLKKEEQLFAPGNAEALAERLECLLAGKTMQRQLGAFNLKESKKHSWGTVAKFMDMELGGCMKTFSASRPNLEKGTGGAA